MAMNLRDKKEIDYCLTPKSKKKLGKDKNGESMVDKSVAPDSERKRKSMKVEKDIIDPDDSDNPTFLTKAKHVKQEKTAIDKKSSKTILKNEDQTKLSKNPKKSKSEKENSPKKVRKTAHKLLAKRSLLKEHEDLDEPTITETISQDEKKKNSPVAAKEIKQQAVSDMEKEHGVGFLIRKMEGMVEKYDSLTHNIQSSTSHEWKKKYDELYSVSKLRYTEPEILLKNLRELLASEKAVLTASLSKLQMELAIALEKLDQEKQRVEKLEKECAASLQQEKEKAIKLEKQNQVLQVDNARLLKLATHNQSLAPTAMEASERAFEVTELNQLLVMERKILDVYRQLTGMHIRLIDNNRGEYDLNERTDVSCTVKSLLNETVCQFELSFPSQPDKEIDYLSMGQYDFLPSYLNDEISFLRSELYPFTKIIMDVLVQKSYLPQQQQFNK